MSGNRAADPPADSPPTGCNCTALIVDRLTADGPAATAPRRMRLQFITDGSEPARHAKLFQCRSCPQTAPWEWRLSVTDTPFTSSLNALGSITYSFNLLVLALFTKLILHEPIYFRIIVHSVTAKSRRCPALNIVPDYLGHVNTSFKNMISIFAPCGYPTVKIETLKILIMLSQ